MRIEEMTTEQKERALARHARAADIIADYERQHSFELPQPWREAIESLLLRGLGDPELHLIFETVMRVEYEAGRLAARPPQPWTED